VRTGSALRIAGALAAGAAIALVVASPPAGAAPDAATLYRQAIATTKGWSVHYTSSGLDSKVTSSESGDAGPASGTQQVLIRRGKTSDQASLVVIGQLTYMKANKTALEDLLDLPSAAASDDTDHWVLFSTENPGVSQVVAGIRSESVAQELTLKGPLTLGTPRSLDGHRVDAIRGEQDEQGAKPTSAILYVRASGRPLIVEEVTVGSQGKPNGEDEITFSRWGERVRPKAPYTTIILGSVSAT
jgi:hypothetical protein